MRRRRKKKMMRKRWFFPLKIFRIIFLLLQVLHPVRRESVSKEALRRGGGGLSENGMDVEEEEEEEREVYRKICENLRHNLESIKAYKKVNFLASFWGLSLWFLF